MLISAWKQLSMARPPDMTVQRWQAIQDGFTGLSLILAIRIAFWGADAVGPKYRWENWLIMTSLHLSL
ncbi:hypothetical protein BST81_23105 [Leptolyngbya sp. 'hensonii']|nr:hypothetical protein BST81_23105 [Leptolyngbya sp. 'hensonii']